MSVPRSRLCATSGVLAFAGVRPNSASTLFFHIYNKNWQHSRANLCVNNIYFVPYADRAWFTRSLINNRYFVSREGFGWNELRWKINLFYLDLSHVNWGVLDEISISPNLYGLARVEVQPNKHYSKKWEKIRWRLFPPSIHGHPLGNWKW